jgi:hypothetical protein
MLSCFSPLPRLRCDERDGGLVTTHGGNGYLWSKAREIETDCDNADFATRNTGKHHHGLAGLTDVQYHGNYHFSSLPLGQHVSKGDLVARYKILEKAVTAVINGE